MLQILLALGLLMPLMTSQERTMKTPPLEKEWAVPRREHMSHAKTRTYRSIAPSRARRSASDEYDLDDLLDLMMQPTDWNQQRMELLRMGIPVEYETMIFGDQLAPAQLAMVPGDVKALMFLRRIQEKRLRGLIDQKHDNTPQ